MMHTRAQSSEKLPSWQYMPNPPRRYGLNKKNRFFIFMILVSVFVWYRYSTPFIYSESEEEALETHVPKTYEEEKNEQAHLLSHDIITAVDEITVAQPAPVVPEVKEEPEPKSKTAPAKEVKEVKEDEGKEDADVEPAESKPMTQEYADEESETKDAVLSNKPKTDKSQGKGASEAIDHAPPAAVKHKSERVLEQHLAPAAKYEEDTTVITDHKHTKFPPYSEYVLLEEKAEVLPDIVHIPLQDSTADIILEGWEDQWFADAELDIPNRGRIQEPKIDFVYTWVNGSDTDFQDTIYPYEVNSTLNDEEGLWLESHRVNRYRDWDELRYSIRSVEKYASTFRNKIQLLVNSVADPSQAANASVDEPATIVGKQRPLWLGTDEHTLKTVQVLSQEDFFEDSQHGALPTFNSLTIENQIYNTKSDTDRFFALSDDMLLGKPHAASDIYSPLFGPTMGFKSNSYNTVSPPTDLDARRFGEKPFLIYTSWLLNRRFGERKRKGQIHFGHSMSRSVTREAIQSFPRPAAQSSVQRFRGETGFQLYSWYVAFHYTIERHREALLWSYIMARSDINQDGNLGWAERQVIMDDLEDGMTKEGDLGFRKRMFYHMNEYLEEAGIEPPKVNIDVQWTSLDGPAAINNIECFEFNVNECLAPGFSTPTSDEKFTNYVFSTASIFDRVTRQYPKCGDCLLKLILNRAQKGLGPLLPHADTQAEDRETVIKAMRKYQYTIVDPDAFFVMVTDAEQVENVLMKRMLKKREKVGQLCLNDDVSTEDPQAVADVRSVMLRLLEGMVPEASAFEADRGQADTASDDEADS